MSTGAAARALDHAVISDAPSNPAAFSGLVNQLGNDHHLARVFVASYRPLARPLPSQVSALIPASIGPPNYAIGSFVLTANTLGASTVQARLSVANFGRSPATLEATISADGKPAGNAQAVVGPGEVATLQYARLPLAQIYQAELRPTDSFPLDNTAFATAPGARSVALLLVSPVPADGESLRAIPGLTVTTRTPDAFTPQDLAKTDIAIFEYTTPKQLPPVNALFVMPPPGDPIFHFTTVQAGQVYLTGWPATDPLTDGVNFRLLNLRSGEYFGEHPWMQPVVSGAAGGLILAGDRGGHRYIATGFNPLPYLGQRNLPMSILTLNLLSRLTGLGAPTAGFRTGEPWLIPAGIKSVTLPSGQELPVTPGQTFMETDQQGIYHLTGTREPILRAVNLSDLAASDLQDVAPVKIETATSAGNPQASLVATPLTPYVLALIIALIVLEALLVYRTRVSEALP
jgi:hypothetical protein